MTVRKKRSLLWYTAVFFTLAVVLGLVCVSDTISADAAGDDTADFRLIFTTDIHGQLTTYNYEQGTEYTGGLSRLYTVIEQARQEAGEGNYLTFDLGDVLYDVTTEYIISQDPEVLQPVYLAMAMIGYDAITLGNHDFDYGYDYIMNQLHASGLIENTVVSNVTDSKTGEHPFGENMLITRTLTTESGRQAELTVGIIGETIPKLSAKTESYTGVLKTEDIVANVTAQAAKLKEAGADLVVVLSHSGFGPENPEENYKNVSYALTKIDDVDVILCGHEHNTFPEESASTNYYDLPGVDRETGLVNGKTVIMVNNRARAIGIADLTFTIGEDGSAKLTGQESEVRKVTASDPVNELIEGLYGDWEDDLKAYCEDIIAEVEEEYTIQNYFGLLEDTSAIQLMNDAKKSYAMNYIHTTKPEYEDLPIVAVSTYKSYGNDGADDYVEIAGRITEANLGSLQSYNTYVNIYKITGKQLKEWLEWAASAYEEINGGSTWTSDEMTALMDSTGLKPLIKQEWMEVWSNFFVFDGIDYTINPSISARYDLAGNQINTGYRVSDVKYNGEAVTDEMEFIIVTDRISQPKDATSWADDQIVYGGYNRSQTVIADYVKLLAKSGTLSLAPDSNWHLKLPSGYQYLVTASSNADAFAREDDWYDSLVLEFGDYDYYIGTSTGINLTDTNAPHIVIRPEKTGPTRSSYQVLVDATDASEIVKLRYQTGDVSADDYSWNIARDITDGSFTVYYNSTYSIYAEDAYGNKTVFRFTVDNIGTDVLGVPTVETYTNRKSSIQGTAELGTIVKFETPDGTYEVKTTSMGTFSYSLPNQKSGTVIYVYAEEIDTGRVSEKLSVRVKRTGPDKPDVNAYNNNSTALTGNTNDEDGDIVVITGNTVYVPEGYTELFESCSDLYQKKYKIVEVEYYVNDNRDFVMILPAQTVGSTLTVYNLDHLSRKSVSTSVKVGEGGPYPPEMYEVTNIEKSVSGTVKALESGEIYTVYGIVNGRVYSTQTDKSGAFTLEFPDEQLEAGDQIIMYTTDTRNGSVRKSSNTVYTVEDIEDFVRTNSAIEISSVAYNAKHISGSYRANETVYISIPTENGNELYAVQAGQSGRYSVTLPEGVTPLSGSYVYVISRYVDAGIITAAKSFVALPLPGMPEFTQILDNTMSVIRIVGDSYSEQMILTIGEEEYVLQDYDYNEETEQNVFYFQTEQITSGTTVTAKGVNSSGAGVSASASVMKLAPDAPEVTELTEGAEEITGTVELLAPAAAVESEGSDSSEEEETAQAEDGPESETAPEEETVLEEEVQEETSVPEEGSLEEEKQPSRTAGEDLTEEEQEEFFRLTQTSIFAKVDGITYSGTVEADGSFVIELPEALQDGEEVSVWAHNYAGKGPAAHVIVQEAPEEESEQEPEQEEESVE